MDVTEYILRVVDQGSGTFVKVTQAAQQTNTQFTEVTKKSKAIDAAVGKTSTNLDGLRKRLKSLKDQKEFIDPKNVDLLKSTNREIGSLEKQIDKLDKTGRRSGGLLSSLGGGLGRFITHPLTIATAGATFGGKLGMGFDEGMAKINITAQLDPQARKQLEKDIKEISARNKFDVTLAPDAFEQIISQVEDVDLTKDIFEQTIRGAKGGFADLGVVAGALAQTLSIVGKDKTNAGEILDTFFTAKRVGAGEFEDFARYLPGLIASADALGVGYQEVAGLYAYMTGKGQRADQAAVLMDNMFSMLGRGDIVDAINASGIATHDKQGNILPFVDIFSNMDTKMGGMSDRGKSQFLEQIGINRMEAKKAFMVMVADSQKLARSIDEVAESAGATDQALEYSRNSVQQAGEVWAAFKGRMLEIGTSALPVITTGLNLLGGAVSFVFDAVSMAIKPFVWWYDKLNEGNPIVWGLTAALAAAGIMLVSHSLKLKVISIWNGIVTGTTGVLSRALAALNKSMLSSPWGWLALGIGAVVGVIAALTKKTDQASKAFAGFNTELNKSKKESNDLFQSAMDAAQGSKERAEGIRKINEQYQGYLPNLLTEKSSNDDLRNALDGVNIELERKLRNKYRDQVINDAQERLFAAETGLYEQAIKGVEDPLQQAEIIRKLNEEILPLFKQGEMSWEDLSQRIDSERVDATGKNVMLSVNSWKIREYSKAFGNLGDQTRIANVLLGNGTSGDSTENGTPGSKSSSKGVISVSGTKAGKTDKTWLDLDKVNGVDTKGSSTYGAIMSKIGRVQMSGLAASVALGIGVGAASLPESVSNAMEIPIAKNDERDYDSDKKFVSMEKFCDTLEIHIANADGQGYDEVRSKIIEVLTEVVDG